MTEDKSPDDLEKRIPPPPNCKKHLIGSTHYCLQYIDAEKTEQGLPKDSYCTQLGPKANNFYKGAFLCNKRD